MLFSLALILLIGFSLNSIFQKLKLPGLIGMLFTGIILGPYVLNLISIDILNVSSQLREIALIVILTRAGLNLNIKDLKKVGRPAILMCFIPATLEIIVVTIIAPTIFNISYIEAAIMGAVLAAVSPAVIVPKMIKLIDEGYGKDKSIPQLIMAGASVDDIYVIVLFTSFIGLYKGEGISISTFMNIPVSIILGSGLGILVGVILLKIFKEFRMRDTVKALVVLSIGMLLVSLEDFVVEYIPISGLIAIMALGATILKGNEKLGIRISNKFSKVWVFFELLLFVLVGASVDISYVSQAGFGAIILIISGLLARVVGVIISLIKTNLTSKERLFCALGYLPKATVQAAIGGLALAQGVSAGNIILAVAVMAILITAPLGAILIDYSYKTLLYKHQ